MDKIINCLLLVIVFVFDPLAVSLIIASNFAFSRLAPSKKSTKKTDSKIPEPLPSVEEEQEAWSEWYNSLPDEEMYPEREMSEEELERYYQIYGETGSIDSRNLDVDYEAVYPDMPKEDFYDDWEIEKEDHSDFEDAEKNIILEEEDPRKRLKDLRTYLNKERIGGINPRLEKDLMNEISTLEKQLSQDESDDLTKTY